MDPATPRLTLEQFLKTTIGQKVPPVTRLIASKLDSGDAPEQIAHALGITTETVNQHLKVIRCFPCRLLAPDDALIEQEEEEEAMRRFAVAVHKAVAAGEPRIFATDAMSPRSRPEGEAAQRAKVLEYLNSPIARKLSADVQKQLRMWAEGASQREVGRKFGVDQGNLSRRVKAVLSEAYKAESAAAQLGKSMQEAQQEEDLESQQREEALRKAVAAGDRKQINKLLSRHPLHNDAMHRATTGGKSHERWAIDPDDLPGGANIRPDGHGPDR